MRAAFRGLNDLELVEMSDASPAYLALRPRDAARQLQISPRLLWQLSHDGVIPCVRVGSGKRRTVLYPVNELRAWLSQQASSAAHVSDT